MEADNEILKIIVKECCRPLSYDDERQQYTFPFRPALPDLWNSIRKRIQIIDSTFHTNDFNNALHRIFTLQTLFIEQSLNEVVDAELLQGEILRVNLIQGFAPMAILIKMKTGQYLDTNTGRGFSLGDRAILQHGSAIITSEGENLGICQSIALLMPTTEHIVMGRVMLGTYYRKQIAASLWPLFNIAKTVGHANVIETCNRLQSMACEMGLGILPLLNIINASIRYAFR